VKSQSKIFNRFSKKSASNIFPSLSRMTTFVVESFRLSKNFIIYFIENHLVFYPTPINLTYAWCFGSAAGICLIIQMLPGIFLTTHYTPHINFLTVVLFTSVVYSTSIKKQTKKQTAFFLIPNSWQVFVETIYDVPSQLLFDNVNVEGEKYFPYISMIFVFIIFNNLIGLLPYSFSKPQVALDAPSFWQTAFQDPAPCLLDKHMAFALSMAVLFTLWVIACSIYFLIGFRKPSKNKLVLSKEVTWVWVLVMVTVLPFIAYGELFELPVARLNPMEVIQEAAQGIPVEETEEEFNAWFLREFEDLEPYPPSASKENTQPPLSPEACDYISHLVSNLSPEESAYVSNLVISLADDLSAKGHSRDIAVYVICCRSSNSFWVLDYHEKLSRVDKFLTAEKWRVFYLRIGAVAVCGIAAIVVGVVWLYS
jgi:F0F1-type ATP synthase membrane subunit a